MDSLLLLVLSAILVIAVVYLRTQLRFARHDADVLRQATVVVAPPESPEQGCLTPLLILLLVVIGLLVVFAGQP